MSDDDTNWFGAGGADYAAHRPDYPAELAPLLAGLAPARNFAVDVGCGTGQLTRRLAEHFGAVEGLDLSADQIANATPAPGGAYRVGSESDTGLPDGVADLITAAQAAHWFDLPAFYREVRRIAVDGALLALITYGVTVIDDDLTERFDRFYVDEIGPFWPPERRHVDNGYRDFDFPFERVDVDVPAIERSWTLDDFLGYLRTWSAVRNAEAQGQAGLLSAFAADLRELWGAPDRRRTVAWPVTVLAGRVDRPR
ncbi:MAG: class I SAM-dependent methyltransferase [Gordonia sp. (in: high G+C Gram-positive bacteria)]